MAKFIYRMQSILNIKEKLEEQARMDFAQANMRLAAEEEKLQQLKDRKLFYEEEGRRLQQDALKVTDFIAEQLLAVRKAEEAVEIARLALMEAMLETKTQHKLKEKAFEEFMREENTREAKEIDELTSYTYGQKQ